MQRDSWTCWSGGGGGRDAVLRHTDTPSKTNLHWTRLAQTRFRDTHTEERQGWKWNSHILTKHKDRRKPSVSTKRQPSTPGSEPKMRGESIPSAFKTLVGSSLQRYGRRLYRNAHESTWTHGNSCVTINRKLSSLFGRQGGVGSGVQIPKVNIALPKKTPLEFQNIFVPLEWDSCYMFESKSTRRPGQDDLQPSGRNPSASVFNSAEFYSPWAVYLLLLLLFAIVIRG